jgi:hypothetical protein
VSQHSCSQGKLRACPLLHHPLKTSLDYYYSTIPRSFPTPHLHLVIQHEQHHHHSLWCRRDILLFIHSLFQSGPPSLLSGTLPFIAHRPSILCLRRPRHSPNASTTFDLRLLPDSSFTYTHLTHLNPTQPGRRTPVLDSTTHGFHPSIPISLLHRQAPVPTTAAPRILTTTPIVASNNCNTLTGHRHDNSRSPNQLAAHISHHGRRHAGTSDAATPTR